MFVKKAMYLAAQAWRQAYGRMATHPEPDNMATLQHKLPSGKVVMMPGWREEQQEDKTVFVGPEGQVYDSLEYAAEAVEQESTDAQKQRAKTTALNRRVESR